MAMALPPHWVSASMKYEQSGKRVFSARLISLSRAKEGPYQSNVMHLGKRMGTAGFYFFMVNGVLRLIGLSFVYRFGL
jgi:hypothetical protein